jgi:hypothetical protein
LFSHAPLAARPARREAHKPLHRLYKVLVITVEMRHATLFGSIRDLSAAVTA